MRKPPWGCSLYAQGLFYLILISKFSYLTYETNTTKALYAKMVWSVVHKISHLLAPE